MRKIITVILGIICAGLFLLSISAIEVTQNRIRQGREDKVEFTDGNINATSNENINERDTVNSEDKESGMKQDNTAANTGQQVETKDTENITQESEMAGSGTTESDTSQSNTNPAAPVLKLLKEKVEIKIGDNFNPLDYIAEIVDDKSSQQYLYRQIMVDGEYNTKIPGTYTLIYTVADEEGNISTGKKLYLTVK